ncbi:MAG TPA: hypothetical protein HPP81_02010 [Deltaproteobacteria bacterium]|nr:hypothetical protein [Deltaproteobacteria bacterium]
MIPPIPSNTLEVRQTRRLFRQLGFRLCKPGPKIAHADPEEQEEYKKNCTQAPEGKRLISGQLHPAGPK